MLGHIYTIEQINIKLSLHGRGDVIFSYFFFIRVEDLSVISNPNTPMRLNQQGFVQWSPAGIYMVNCESDITYYPLDYQTCDLKLTTSSYTTYEIRLQMVSNVVNLDFYTKNGEWELLSATGMQSDDKARGGRVVLRSYLSVSLAQTTIISRTEHDVSRGFDGSPHPTDVQTSRGLWREDRVLSDCVAGLRRVPVCHIREYSQYIGLRVLHV